MKVKKQRGKLIKKGQLKQKGKSVRRKFAVKLKDIYSTKRHLKTAFKNILRSK